MRTLLLAIFLFVNTIAEAESYLYFQNNTSQDIEISTSSTLDKRYWVEAFSGTAEAWKLQTRIFSANRDQGILIGDDFYLTTTLTISGETVDLKMKLTGSLVGSSMWESASGPGFEHAWYDDSEFHSEAFTINKKQYILKYRADISGGDAWYNLYYVLHEVNPYAVLSSDLEDSHVFNVLAYNVFMLTPPIGSDDGYERSLHIYNAVRNQDALIISEAFYNTARVDNLIPLISKEYPYYTTVVDEQGRTEDGGVMIFSRWPILQEEQHVFTECNGSDCFAAKGVKYAQINKKGTIYHLFGTHTQAWTGTEDIAIRKLQLAELRGFIGELNIPQTEAVLIGGDLNVDKIANHQNEYDNMFVTLDAVVPDYVGVPFTYSEADNAYATTGAEYLDYVLSENQHFTAYSSVNEPQILRTAASADDLWDKNTFELDLSDHFAVQGRFVYPRFYTQPNDSTLCVGDPLTLSVKANVKLNLQWYLNNTPIDGATSSSYTIPSSSVTDSGNYCCRAIYPNGEICSDTVLVNIAL